MAPEQIMKAIKKFDQLRLITLKKAFEEYVNDIFTHELKLKDVKLVLKPIDSDCEHATAWCCHACAGCPWAEHKDSIEVWTGNFWRFMWISIDNFIRGDFELKEVK